MCCVVATLGIARRGFDDDGETTRDESSNSVLAVRSETLSSAASSVGDVPAGSPSLTSIRASRGLISASPDCANRNVTRTRPASSSISGRGLPARWHSLTIRFTPLPRYLLANARRVLTREQILENVWDYTFAGNASVLETYISYLRAKIDIEEPPLLHTVPRHRLRPATPTQLRVIASTPI